MNSILFLILAYLLGSIPFGLLVTRKVKGIDLRRHGSKNIGATNVFRVVGKKWGILVFFLDALKGYLAVSAPSIFSGDPAGMGFRLALGVCAIAGHSFPVWLGFKGGKGVATSLGVFLAAAPGPAWITFGIWWIVFLTSRILSLASLAAAAVFPAAAALLYRKRPELRLLLPVSLLLAIFIFYTHRANLARLRRGEEKKLF